MNTEELKIDTEYFTVLWDRTHHLIHVSYKCEHDIQAATMYRDTIGPIWDAHPDFRASPILMDATNMGSLSQDVRKLYVEAGKRYPHPIIAVIGLSTLLRVALSFITFAMGRSNDVKAFGTRDEALAWLKEHFPDTSTQTNEQT